MLLSYRRGYAVMNKTLDAYAFEDESLECCKRYCRNGDVIVEMIPVVCGFNLRIFRLKDYRPRTLIEYRDFANLLRIWKLHIQWGKEYRHRHGRIVYESQPTE